MARSHSDPSLHLVLSFSETARRLGRVTFNQASGFVTIGQPVDLSSSINISTSANSGPFDQLVEGAQFHDVLLQGTLNFAATPFVPSPGGSNTTPFTMSGQLAIFNLVPFQGPGALVGTAMLTGSGTAGLGLDQNFGGGQFSSRGISFSFEPERCLQQPEQCQTSTSSQSPRSTCHACPTDRNLRSSIPSSHRMSFRRSSPTDCCRTAQRETCEP